MLHELRKFFVSLCLTKYSESIEKNPRKGIGQKIRELHYTLSLRYRLAATASAEEVFRLSFITITFEKLSWKLFIAIEIPYKHFSKCFLRAREA